MAFMPTHAPFVVLGFLFALFLLFVGGILLLVAVFTRKYRLLGRVAAGVVVVLGLYLGALLTVSLASREVTLAPYEEKYFCEIDCHIAYSADNLLLTKTLGTAPNEARAAGTFYVVTVRTWFDPRTISPHRGNGPLSPNPRRVVVVDDQGREISVSPQGQRALEETPAKSVPLTQPLRPGESYESTFVFDLPSGTRNPRLLITDADEDWIPHLLVGHEGSFWHKKILFRLEPSAQPATGSSGVSSTPPDRRYVADVPNLVSAA